MNSDLLLAYVTCDKLKSIWKVKGRIRCHWIHRSWQPIENAQKKIIKQIGFLAFVYFIWQTNANTTSRVSPILIMQQWMFCSCFLLRSLWVSHYNSNGFHLFCIQMNRLNWTPIDFRIAWKDFANQRRKFKYRKKEICEIKFLIFSSYFMLLKHN